MSDLKLVKRTSRGDEVEVIVPKEQGTLLLKNRPYSKTANCATFKLVGESNLPTEEPGQPVDEEPDKTETENTDAEGKTDSEESQRKFLEAKKYEELKVIYIETVKVNPGNMKKNDMIDAILGVGK